MSYNIFYNDKLQYERRQYGLYDSPQTVNENPRSQSLCSQQKSIFQHGATCQLAAELSHSCCLSPQLPRGTEQ